MTIQTELEDYAKQHSNLLAAIDQLTAAFDQVVEQLRVSVDNYWEQLKDDDGDDHDDTDISESTNNIEVRNVAAGETAVYEDVVTDADSFSGGAINNGLKAIFAGDTATLELNDVGVYKADNVSDFSDFDSSFAITLDEEDDASIETLNIISQKESGIVDKTANYLFDVTNGDTEGLQSLETINLEFDFGSDTNLLLDGESLAGVTSIDASRSDADLNLALPPLENTDSALESVLLGDRNDQFTLSTDRLTADSLDIGVGGGENVVALTLGEPVSDSATATAITLKSSGDSNKFQLQGGNIIQEDINDGVFTNTVTILGFTSGFDKLQLEGYEGLAEQSAVDAALDSQDTLYNNVVNIADALDEGSTAWFIFRDSYYYYQDTNPGGDDGTNFSAGDTLIELPGVEFDQGFSPSGSISSFTDF
nr:hypothetical protein [uncultured Halomonas sp.]